MGFLKAEKGFTLVELMCSVVILGIAIGAISQALVGGQRLMNKQASQMDLRRGSRQLTTKMEKDVQAATSVIATSDGYSYQELQLFDNSATKTAAYRFDAGDKKIRLYDYTVNPSSPSVKVVASDVEVVSFASLKLGTAASHGDTGSTPTLTQVPLKFTLAQSNESLVVATNSSPRWNIGDTGAFIQTVTPGYYTYSTSLNYVALTINGINTHFRSDSVVTLQDGPTVFASSRPNGFDSSNDGQSATYSSGRTDTTLNTVRLWAVDSNNNQITTPLPFGYYDVFVTTPSQVEKVYKFSALAIRWGANDWDTSNGNNSGWNSDPNNFPFISKYQVLGNANNKAYYYKPGSVSTAFDDKIGIVVTNPTTGSLPNGEIATWLSVSGNNKLTYWGFGINKNSVFYRKVVDDIEVWSVKVSTNSSGGPIISNGSAVLEITSDTNGNVHLWVNNRNVDDLFDAAHTSQNVTSYSRNWGGSVSGSQGVIAPETGQVRFEVVRM